MSRFFLSLKHWQLFLLILVLPLLIDSVFMYTEIIDKGPERESLNFRLNMMMSGFVMAVMLYGWHISIVNGLVPKIKEGVRPKSNKFFLAVLYILVYFVVVTVFYLFDVKNFAVIIPFHLLAMFCVLYTLWFCAKVKKTAELQKKVSFMDFFGEFFLLWFFPIGIWFIQPHLNKLSQTADKNRRLTK